MGSERYGEKMIHEAFRTGLCGRFCKVEGSFPIDLRRVTTRGGKAHFITDGGGYRRSTSEYLTHPWRMDDQDLN